MTVAWETGENPVRGRRREMSWTQSASQNITISLQAADTGDGEIPD